MKPIDSVLLTKLAAGYTALSDAHYNLGGVAFWLGPEGLDIVANDGHTLFHGHLPGMTSREPLSGMLEAAKAAKGEEPDMEKGDAGVVRFPSHQRVVEVAVKRHAEASIPLDQVGWRDFDYAAKLAKVMLGPEVSMHVVRLGVDEGKYIVEAKSYEASMRHELLWPAPSKAFEKFREAGLQAAYARRLCGTAMQLPRASWSLAPHDIDAHVARGVWDGGEVTLLCMPCRL